MRAIDRANAKAKKPESIGYHADDKYFTILKNKQSIKTCK